MALIRAANYIYSASIFPKIHIISYAVGENIITSSIFSIYRVYGSPENPLFPHFVFIGEEGKKWNDHFSDESILPIPLIKAINNAIGKDIDSDSSITSTIYSSDISDIFFDKVGFIEQSDNLAHQIRSLLLKVEERVTHREKIDILS